MIVALRPMCSGRPRACGGLALVLDSSMPHPWPKRGAAEGERNVQHRLGTRQAACGCGPRLGWRVAGRHQPGAGRVPRAGLRSTARDAPQREAFMGPRAAHRRGRHRGRACRLRAGGSCPSPGRSRVFAAAAAVALAAGAPLFVSQLAMRASDLERFAAHGLPGWPFLAYSWLHVAALGSLSGALASLPGRGRKPPP